MRKLLSDVLGALIDCVLIIADIVDQAVAELRGEDEGDVP